MLALQVNRSHPSNRWRNEMDRLFENTFEGFPKWRPEAGFASAFPPVNVWEDAENIYVEAELPGFKLDDLELQIMGDELTIKGERQVVREDDVSYHRKERTKGCFSRDFQMPVEVDADNTKATLSDGVLLITIPKTEQAKPRKVEVKALPGEQ